MGVPGLFAWLKRKYPIICHPLHKKGDGSWEHGDQVDNVYIDMNHIIHCCTHAGVGAKDGNDELSEASIYAHIHVYLDVILEATRPTNLVVLAVDGVAPRAKMAQQRTRRFLSAHVAEVTERVEQEVRREMLSEAGGTVTIPPVKRFDSNVITPGTAFMVGISSCLKDWARKKLQSSAAASTASSSAANYSGTPKIIISDACEPGEGEHKILRLMRTMRVLPDYNPNTKHLIYGQDADLLLLSLLLHEPHVLVMRELYLPASSSLDDLKIPAVGHGTTLTEAERIKVERRSHVPGFEMVDVAVLRSSLSWEFEEFFGSPQEDDSSSEDGEGGGEDMQCVTSVQAAGQGGSSCDLEHRCSLDTKSNKKNDEGGVCGTTREKKSIASSSKPSCHRPSIKAAACGVTFERVLEDLVVLTFFSGNDFLPHVPSISLHDVPNGMDLLFSAYRALLPELGSGISSHEGIHAGRLSMVLSRVARDENRAFERRARYNERKAREEQEAAAAASGQVDDVMKGLGGWVSMGSCQLKRVPPWMRLWVSFALDEVLGDELCLR
ncbi:hypothetical protein CEUSTIGMA_g1940.t1 [Chlamydomonas eustigma]|uniref:Xrn1 N-terminal domain-containing protein n=1 Tax=Chlamydomonas eustigma TaxID=1157962 RepID=A0A250WUK2_9CHLO|nr:hypothetical protein CEUSTIGMA_g1940.t1 [Chlamydomonas eustigma]|eukprot:GAX74491.1 hypothetical protein CEUSTIGMA_g1940.t1 [Chlamydomonas eustigma]